MRGPAMSHARESDGREKGGNTSPYGGVSGTLSGTFRTSFKTAIANRKSTMLLLNQAST